MSEIKRISVEEGVALFERTGLRPDPLNYLREPIDGPPCGCLLAAKLVDRVGIEQAKSREVNRWWNERRLAPFLGMDPSYLAGLEAGFCGWCNKRDDERFALGYRDGAAIRRRVLPVTAEGGEA